MEEPKHYKITVEDPEGGVLSLVFPYLDPGIDDWGRIFKAILFWLGFHPSTVKELLGDDE